MPQTWVAGIGWQPGLARRGAEAGLQGGNAAMAAAARARVAHLLKQLQLAA